MNVTVIHGSPRKGNTYKALQVFESGLTKCGEVNFSEFRLPQALPDFCTGCQLCMGGSSCPHGRHAQPILSSMLDADALIFTSPNYSLNVSAAMKNFLEHFDHLYLTVCPNEKFFEKKAFIITTGSGSAKAAAVIKESLKYWGVNRVYSYGIRMFTNEWDAMPGKKQHKIESKLCAKAKKFYKAKKRAPYISTRLKVVLSRFVLKRYIGKDAYPYKYWEQKGWLKTSPFKKND